MPACAARGVGVAIVCWRLLAAIVGLVGVGLKAAAGSFPDIPGHVGHPFRRQASGVATDGCCFAAMVVVVGALGIRLVVAPRVAAAPRAARRALPFQFARNLDQVLLGIVLGVPRQPAAESQRLVHADANDGMVWACLTGTRIVPIIRRVALFGSKPSTRRSIPPIALWVVAAFGDEQRVLRIRHRKAGQFEWRKCERHLKLLANHKRFARDRNHHRRQIAHAGAQVATLAQQIVSGFNPKVEVSSAAGTDITFKGDQALTFAFTCVRMYVRLDGTIGALPPGEETYTLDDEDPPKVLLGNEVGLIGLDDQDAVN